MGADEAKAWADAIGPTAVMVLALVLIVLPALRRASSEKHELPASTQVDLALMRKTLDDHEARLKAIEAKRTRA
jgi:hypothetical protein